MKLSKKSNGFSLIEVLIALVILSIALLALAGLMVQSTRNTSFGGHLTEAATFAQDRLEELRVTSWNNIISGNDPIPPTGSTGINYTRSWVVSTLPNPNPPPNDLQKTVTITVSWNDGINRSIRLLSVISN